MAAETSIVITAQAGQAERTMGSLGNSVEGLGKKFTGLSSLAGSLGGALSIAAFSSFIKNTVNGIDALNDMADATGASIENLSALEIMAGRTGTSFDTVGTALVKFNAFLSEAKPGSPAEQALKAIGLSAVELRRIDPAEALRLTAVALNGFADDGNKARFVQDAFGKSVREVAPLLKDLAEQGKLAGVVTKDMADQADQFNKNLAVLETNAKNAARALTTDLITGLNKLAAAYKQDGISGLFGGLRDDEYLNNKRLVELTNELLYAENALSKSRARDAQFGDKSLATAAAEKRLAAIKAELEVVQGYRRVLENGPTGQPAAAEPEKEKLGPVADPRVAKEAAAKARKELDALLKDWEGFNDAIDPLAAARALSSVGGARVQKAYEEEQRITQATIDGFNQRTAVLAEQVAVQDLSEEERILFKRDQEFARLEEEKRVLEEHNKWNLEMEQRYTEARFNAQAQASSAIVKLEKQTAQQKQQTLVSSLGIISSLMSSNNETMFNIGKAAAIANATIATYEGAQKAIGQLGVWGIPVAAGIVAAGIMQVNQIASTKIGGGTPSPVNATFSGGSVQTGTTPNPITAPLPAPNAEAAVPRQRMDITLVGDAFSYDNMVNVIIPKINEAAGNGVDIVVSRG